MVDVEEDDMTADRGPGLRRRVVAGIAALIVATVALSSCSLTAESTNAAPGGDPVVLVTHDSFAMSDEVRQAFEEQTGYVLDIRGVGDAGAMVNQLVLTKEAPLGDAVFGIDTTFASRALDEGIVTPYTSAVADDNVRALAAAGSDRLTAVSYSDVCVNVDRTWFAKQDIPEPATLEDLTDPSYANLLVVQDPATSSPGLAFLLATVAAFGHDGWQDYWARLRDNGVEVAAGWTDAYYVDFSGPSSEGDRPLVVSYASSPPFEVAEGAEEAPTRALLDTCFRQVEYAGVLDGAANADGAQALIDFMLSPTFQNDIPGQMYVYPASGEATLPPDWVQFAPLSPRPFQVAPEQIAANRQSWIEQWTSIVIG